MPCNNFECCGPPQFIPIVDEVPIRSATVRGLRANNAGAAYIAGSDALVRVTVGGVETAGEATENLEVRLCPGSVDDRL